MQAQQLYFWTLSSAFCAYYIIKRAGRTVSHPFCSLPALFRTFLFLKGTTGCLMTVACTISFDIHMFRMALIICIVHAVGRFAIDTDRSARMLQSTYIGISRPFPRKTFTACIIFAFRMLASHHNITFAAAFTFVVYAVFHTAIQLSHIVLLSYFPSQSRRSPMLSSGQTLSDRI